MADVRVGASTDSILSAVFAIVPSMTVRALKELMQRVETWPEAAQEELADIALEIEAGIKAGAYHASPEELAGIDRGLRAAHEGRFATDKQVDAVFAKHRRT